MKHLFTLKSLLLTLVMLCGLNAWGETATLTFTKACKGSGTDDKGNTWTVTSDAAESSFDNTKGVHYGTKNNAVSYLQLTTTINGTITAIKVNASGASGTSANLNVTVGGSPFGSQSSINKTAKDYTFTGNATGEIVVKLSQTSATKALYVKSIEVTYTTAGGGEAVTVAKPTFSLASGTYYGPQEVTIQIPDGAKRVMYTTDDTDPSFANPENGVSITENTTIPVSETTTIQAIAVDASGNESAVASATYTIVPSIANTKETALTTAEAIDLIDATNAEQLADPTQKVYVKGVISKIDSYNSKYKSITYWLDGDAFMVYSGKGKGGADFATVDDVAVGANVIVVGNLKKHNTTYEFDYNNELVEYTAPAGFVEKPVITETSTPDFGYSYYTTSTATATIASATEGATIKYAITGVDVTDAATIESWTEGTSVSITSDVAGTKILWAKAVKDGKESVVASKEFTFTTEVAPEGTYFVLVTDASQIVEGAKYVITDSECTAIANELTNGKYFSYSNGITDNGGVLTVDASTNYTYFKFENIADAADAYKWHMTFEDNDGSYKYLTSSTSTSSEKKDLKVAESAETADGVSISFSGNDAVISFKNSYTANKVQYRIRFNSGRFKTYGTSTGTTVYLYRLVKEVPVATTVGLDKVINGKIGRNYEINCALRVNYKDANYVYASTTENNSSKKNTANEGDKGKGWSDKEDKFTQNDWVAIQNSGLELGDQVAIGSVATLVSNGAFPVIEFVSMSKDAPERPFEANTFRVANFNIGKDVNAVKYVWLVAPQAGEFCHVRGYVAAAEGGKVTLKSAKESSTVTVDGKEITVDPVGMTVNYSDAVTTGNWFSFTGIVVNGTNGLELNAISAEDVSTGVEGVEASSVKVYGAEGVINVVSEEVAPIAVYSANGAIVSSVEASSASIAVAPGFYIVKAGNSVSKVTVK